jgi:hypothetical protein
MTVLRRNRVTVRDRLILVASELVKFSMPTLRHYQTGAQDPYEGCHELVARIEDLSQWVLLQNLSS